MKKGLILLMFISITASAQIEVSEQKNLLLGGAANETYTPEEGEIYHPNISIANINGLYWQRVNNYFQVQFDGQGAGDEYIYVSGSGDQVTLYNTQTSTFNALRCDEGYSQTISNSLETLSSSHNSLALLSALHPVTYNWKSSLLKSADAETLKSSLRYGFLAQEVENVLPKVVNTDSVGEKTMDYNAILPIVAGSIQDLQCRLINQQNDLADLNDSGLRKKMFLQLHYP